jgi:hypothetical protein
VQWHRSVRVRQFSDAYAEFRTAAEHDRAPSHAIIGSRAKRLLYSLIAGSGDSLSPGEQRCGFGYLVRGAGGGVAPVVVEGGGTNALAVAEAERDAAIGEHKHNWDHSAAIRRQRFRDDVMAIVDGERKVLVADVTSKSAPPTLQRACARSAHRARAAEIEGRSQPSLYRRSLEAWPLGRARSPHTCGVLSHTRMFSISTSGVAARPGQRCPSRLARGLRHRRIHVCWLV